MKSARCFLVAALLTAAAGSSAAASPPRAERYPYGGPAFTRFVADSYREAGARDPQTFYRWMDAAYRRGTGDKRPPSWPDLLERKRRSLRRAAGPAARAKGEMALGLWLHRTIKAMIPKFSLDRGFEFTNAVRLGERQCLLQSVLIAGLMQASGVDAGIVMVNRNIAGSFTNNGHVVTLVKLSDGRDVLVDASDPTPFVHHRGLFVADGASGVYRYVAPVYDRDSCIPFYRAAADDRKIATRTGALAPLAVRTLDVGFVRSQFDFYRGERAPGGLLAARPTPAGLEAATRHLRAAIGECPGNPLPVYLLGRVFLKRNKTEAARRQFETAYPLYARAGWVPQGEREALARTGSSLPATTATARPALVPPPRRRG